MNTEVESLGNWFNRIYLGGILLLMKNETAFLSFIRVLTTIEAMAS